MLPVPILTTKFNIPALHPEHLPRPRLAKRLAQGVDRKLTLVSAPAGFGKTMLVTEWLRAAAESDIMPAAEKLPPSFAWLSLDTADNDPALFWPYAITALNRQYGHLGGKALDLLSAPQPAPIESVLIMLINDLTGVTEKFGLVLDDFHVIENRQICTDLAFLLEHLPAAMHLVVTTRVDPPLPLARLRARQQLNELRAEDLRFTPTETVQFFDRIKGLNLSAADVTALESRTEGWVVGLQLAALSLQQRPNPADFIASFTGSHQYILDYLTLEVLQPQPAHIQAFLLETAILDQLTGALCNAVTGRADSQAILEQLAAANLFVMPLDDQRRWYRYHQLFADLLRHRLQQTTVDVPALYCRAAHWYEQQGDVEKAINYALAAPDAALVQRLIEQNFYQVLKRGKYSRLLNWFDALGTDHVVAHPELGVAYAWLLFYVGRLNEAKNIITAQGQILLVKEFAGHQSAWGALRSLQAQFAMFQGKLTEAVEFSTQALRLLSDDEPDLLLRAFTEQNLAIIYWLMGNQQAADHLLTQTTLIDRFQQTNPGTAAIITALNQAELHQLHGKLTQAAQLYRRVLHLVTDHHLNELPMLVGMAHAELGHMLHEWNDLETATHHLKAALELCERGAGIRVAGRAHQGMTMVLKAQGNVTAALELLDTMETKVREFDLSFPMAMAALQRINLYITQGNLEPVAQWVQQHQPDLPNAPARPRIMELTIRARALLALSQKEAALALLTRLRQVTETADWLEFHIKILALQALAFQQHHQQPQALAALEQALRLAEPEGYIRTFVDESAPMAALLLNLLPTRRQPAPPEALPSVAYLQKLLNVLHVDGAALVKAASSPLANPLTDREREVLQLITAGMSTKKIAARLVIADSTLKTHLKNIYGKLDAHNRLDAVAKAKALNLI
jgi:LuxR family maltose regulon positive regulatory protein